MLQDIKDKISLMGFTPIDGKTNLWHKKYCNGNYEIIVDLSNSDYHKCTIDYGDKIQYDRKTTCNFSDQENTVVLECINRLLEKGYKPENLILEKKWKLGLREKGHLDILVLDETGKSFMMIECKTWGLKYNQEKNKMLVDGGQLFSYYKNELSSKYLILYSSRLSDCKIDYKNDIVEINESFAQCDNEQEIFDKWDKVFETKGVFEQPIPPYKIKFTGITKRELDNLEADDGKYIYSQFVSILRRHTVSDKTNAFNKIFNLFLCKIVDEDSKTGNTEEMSFQWREKENNKEVLMRLNDLYKEGMKRYLKMEISDYSEKEIEKILSALDGTKHDELKEMITELRLYKNNEFAFKEVFDEKSFDENCIIVKEVVKLLEGYKIKYSTKQQFLGDFFERLLNTGIKQEAGQFFTPIPIARFICSSIPLEDIIKEKINNKEADFLPYVIDFASGSGHFLTEAMDCINTILTDLPDKGFTKPMMDNLKEYKISYKWAKEFVYGIEKDYRLAKTSKVSCFLNGDGDANVICCDGLDNFYYSKEFEGLLKTRKETKDNQVFDVIIANPPYSVDDFKYTLKNAKASFELYNKITSDSKEIECLFLERAKQLLKEGGFAGIILPTSLLYNNKIYVATRDILLKYFEIKSIVELGSNTFMATGKNTSIFFLKRRNNKQWLKIQDNIDNFFNVYKDISSNGIENVFSKYSKDVYEYSLSDYISLISRNPNKNILCHSYYIDFKEYFESLNEIKHLKERGKLNDEEYKTRFFDLLIKSEKQKLLYYILTYQNKVVCVNTGEKNSEKDFLGYKFSDRESIEGIDIFKDDYGKIDSKLYSDDDINDASKTNSYILRNFRNIKIDNISDDLKHNIKIQTLDSMLILNNVQFTNAIYTSKTKQIESKWDKKKLTKICPVTDIILDNGTGAPQNKKYFKGGDIPFIRANNLNFLDEKYCVIPQKESLINEIAIKECELKKFKAGTILFAKSGAAAKTSKIAMLKKDAYIVNHLACLYLKDELLRLYMYYLLKYYKTANFIPIGSDYPSINIKDIKNFNIPIPPQKTMKKIVSEIQKIDTKLNKAIREKKEETIIAKYL